MKLETFMSIVAGLLGLAFGLFVMMAAMGLGGL